MNDVLVFIQQEAKAIVSLSSKEAYRPYNYQCCFPFSINKNFYYKMLSSYLICTLPMACCRVKQSPNY